MDNNDKKTSIIIAVIVAVAFSIFILWGIASGAKQADFNSMNSDVVKIKDLHRSTEKHIGYSSDILVGKAENLTDDTLFNVEIGITLYIDNKEKEDFISIEQINPNSEEEFVTAMDEEIDNYKIKYVDYDLEP